MVILASKSPRRQELLKKICKDFIVIESHYDESSSPDFPPDVLSSEQARLKAYAVFSKHPKDIVIGCDTIVVIDGEILGKPKDEEDAFRMLKKLSGQKHIVLSSYTIINKNMELSRTVKSVVYFNKLSDKLILDYIKKCKPLDKAGAYGIQDKEFNLIEKIVGSFYNVMGLPIEDIERHYSLVGDKNL